MKKRETTESGLIYDIKRFAIHDGPGIRTTVFFKGCPLHCWWCHNPESRSACIEPQPNPPLRKNPELFPADYKFLGKELTIKEVMSVVKKDMMFYEESGGGVTFSGGEPLNQERYLNLLLKQCGDSGIHRVIDTTGYAPKEKLKVIVEQTDLFLYDIKFVDGKQHLKYTGVSNKIILENLEYIVGLGKEVLVRIPLVPGITDTENNLGQIINYLLKLKKDIPVDLLPYNPMGENKYYRLGMELKTGKFQKQSADEITQIKAMFEGKGISVI